MRKNSEQGRKAETGFCPCRNILDILSRKWSFLIINTLGNFDTLRFNELKETLQDINPKTLSETLTVLQSENLIKKEKYNEIPPRVEYSLTKDGKELRKAILPLVKWAANRESKDYKYEIQYPLDSNT